MARDNGGQAVWFLAGAAVGATLALLYAPQTGTQTRRLLVKKSKQGREVLGDSGRDLMDRGRELYEKGRRVADEAADLIERGRKMVDG